MGSSIFINTTLYIAILSHARIVNITIENILLSEDGDLSSLKIADFGLSAQLDFHFPKNAKAQCGTLLFMAP